MVLDDKGIPQPTGELETLAADSVVLALGQDVDLSLLDGVPGLELKDGVVQVGAEHDDRPRRHLRRRRHGARRAHRHGRRRPRQEGGAPYRRVVEGQGLFEGSRNNEAATFDKLNTWYYSDAPKTVQPVLDLVRRQSTFDEVVKGLDESNALYEARRCLSCGNCFECDNCYGVCPDNAVIKLGPGKRFQFNYDYCKGCGICAAECPCGAIRMVPEEI